MLTETNRISDGYWYDNTYHASLWQSTMEMLFTLPSKSATSMPPIIIQLIFDVYSKVKLGFQIRLPFGTNVKS